MSTNIKVIIQTNENIKDLEVYTTHNMKANTQTVTLKQGDNVVEIPNGAISGLEEILRLVGQRD